MTLARGKRLRVCVEVDAIASTDLRRMTKELAARCTAAVAKSDAWKVHGVSVTDVSTGTAIARFESNGREYVRVATDTGEVLP